MPRLTVLWIEDDGDLVGPFRKQLHHAAVDVVWAATGATALELAASQPVDLLIVDQRLKEGPQGLQVLASIRRSNIDTPAIVLTSDPSFDSALCAGSLGVLKYCRKPLVGRALVETIRTALVLGRAHPMPSQAEAGTGGVHRPVYDRWAAAMVAVIHALDDPRTAALWAVLTNASVGALRGWCDAARLSTRRSLLLARLLRAIRMATEFGGRAQDFLDVADRRTAHGLFALACINPSERDLVKVLSQQQLIRNPYAIAELERLLVR